VDLNQVDIAVLSHRHYDHISGFDYMLKVKPMVKAYLPADPALALQCTTHSPMTQRSLWPACTRTAVLRRPHHSMDDYKPGERFHGANQEFCTAAGDRSRHLSDCHSLGHDGRLQRLSTERTRHPDLAGFPELSLALKTEKGIVLITGCSHSTVEAIIRATKHISEPTSN